MLGHELRNPLAPIVTAVELLKLQGQGDSREVSRIERQSQHLIRLVDDLLDIAHHALPARAANCSASTAQRS